MPASRPWSVVVLLATLCALAPAAVSAQTYFTPLVTPPASAGTCMPPQQVPVRGDTTHVVQHRLVMKSTPPGDSREILIVTGRGRSVVYSDMTHVTLTPTSARSATVVAVTDTLGRMRGWWMRGTMSLPDSLVRRHPDSATLQRLRSLERQTDSSRTLLSSADEARVREMTAWALKRCR